MSVHPALSFEELDSTELSLEKSEEFSKLIEQFNENNMPEIETLSEEYLNKSVSSNDLDLAEPAPNITKPEQVVQRQVVPTSETNINEHSKIIKQISKNEVKKEEDKISTVENTDSKDHVTTRRESSFFKKLFVGLILVACSACVLYIILAIYKNYFAKEKLFHEKLVKKDEDSLLTPDSVEGAVKLFLRKMK